MAQPTEVKVKGAAGGALVASLALALLNATVADSSILGGLPAWLQFILLAVAPTLVTWLAGYATPSTTSSVSESFNKPSVR
jgi:hypothetical protein